MVVDEDSASSSDSELFERGRARDAARKAAQVAKAAKANSPETFPDEHPLSAVNPANQLCYAAMKGDLPRLQRLVEQHGTGIVWQRCDFRVPREPAEEEANDGAAEGSLEEEAPLGPAEAGDGVEVAAEGLEDSAPAEGAGSETEGQAPELNAQLDLETPQPAAVRDSLSFGLCSRQLKESIMSIDSLEESTSTATPESSAQESISTDAAPESNGTAELEGPSEEVDAAADDRAADKNLSREERRERTRLRRQMYLDRQAELEREKQAKEEAAIQAMQAAAKLKRAEEKAWREKRLKAQIAAEASRLEEASKREQRNNAEREKARFVNYAQLLETPYLGALPLEVAVRHHGADGRNTSDKRDLRDVIDHLLELEPELGSATAQEGLGAISKNALTEADCTRLGIAAGSVGADLVQNRWVPPLLWAARYETSSDLCLLLIEKAKADINQAWQEGNSPGGERVCDSYATDPEELYKLLAHGLHWRFLPVPAVAARGNGGTPGQLAALAAHGQNVHTDIMERAMKNTALEALRVTQARTFQIGRATTKWMRFLGPSARDVGGGGAAVIASSAQSASSKGLSAWATTADVLHYLHVKQQFTAVKQELITAKQQLIDCTQLERDHADLEKEVALARKRCFEATAGIAPGGGSSSLNEDQVERQLKFLALPDQTLARFDLANVMLAGGRDAIEASKPDHSVRKNELAQAELASGLAAFKSLITSAFSNPSFLPETLFPLLIDTLQQRVRKAASAEQVNSQLLASALKSLHRVWDLKLSKGPADIKDGASTLRLVFQRLLMLFLQDEYLLVRDRSGEQEVLFATTQRESVEFMARLLNNDAAKLGREFCSGGLHSGAFSGALGAKPKPVPSAGPLPQKDHLEFNFTRSICSARQSLLPTGSKQPAAAPWECGACTLHNEASAKCCIVCGGSDKRSLPDVAKSSGGQQLDECTAFAWVSAAVSVGKAAFKLWTQNNSDASNANQLPRLVAPPRPATPSKKPVSVSKILLNDRATIEKVDKEFLKVAAEFDHARASWTPTAVEALCKKLKRRLETDPALWTAVSSYPPFTGTGVDVEAVLAARADALEPLLGRSPVKKRGSASAAAPQPDAADSASLKSPPRTTPAKTGFAGAGSTLLTQQASSPGESSLPAVSPAKPVVRNGSTQNRPHPTKLAATSLSSEFYVAKRVKNASSFEFLEDVLAPIVAVLLHAQNEYGWGAPSCGQGTQLIVMQVLSGRVESADDCDFFDGDDAAKKTTRERVDAAVLKDIGAMLLGSSGAGSIPQLLAERLSAGTLVTVRKFLNEQNTEAMDNQLLKQALSVSAAENSKKTAQTGPWVLQENPQPATDTGAKRPATPLRSVQKIRTAEEILSSGKSRKAVRRALDEYRSRILGPLGGAAPEDDDEPDNDDDDDASDDEIIMMTPEELRQEAIHLLTNSIFARGSRSGKSANRNPFCLPLTPETRKQKRRNLKAILEDIYMANGDFAENRLRGEFFKAVWDRLRMNWYGGRGSRRLLRQVGEIADALTQAFKSDLEFYEAVTEKRR